MLAGEVAEERRGMSLHGREVGGQSSGSPKRPGVRHSLEVQNGQVGLGQQLTMLLCIRSALLFVSD